MNCKRCKKGVFLIVQLRRHYNHRHLPPYYYILPWQMKSIRIIKISYHKKPRNAVFWGILPTCFFYYKSYILSADFAKYGKTVQFTPLIRSKIVVKIGGITTLDFAPFFQGRGAFAHPKRGIVKRVCIFTL